MFNTPPVFPVYVSMLTLRWLKNNGGVEWIEKVNSKNGFETNMYDSSIVRGSVDGSWSKSKYFTKPPMPILFKYYIEDTGVIWRGSKGAKALDQVREELSIGNKKESHRKNLGL
jgi:hypothetical protein